jgi:hypothetical protein
MKWQFDEVTEVWAKLQVTNPGGLVMRGLR